MSLETQHPCNAEDFSRLLVRLRANISSIFRGKEEVISLALVALLADGHLLLEDVPGVGKTTLAKAIAKSLNCTFRRIQFTPDLLPADLTGTSVFHPPSGTFNFHEGPLFAQVILADEINRATPRTQSALLEAMSERQITIDGNTRRLGPPFLVLATQNPYEFEGTYPLPESQLDRFLMRISVGYPNRDAERTIFDEHREGEPVDRLQPVLNPAEVLHLQRETRSVLVSEPVSNYILDLIQATREHPEVALGASTRASLMYYRACQAAAWMAGRRFVTPDDVKTLAIPVLSHRLMTKSWERNSRENAVPIVREIIAKTPVRL